MQTAKRIVKIIATGICAGGMVWFFLPVIRSRGVGLWTIFGECVCLLGIFLVWRYSRISKKGGWKQVAVRLIAFGFVAGLAWSAYLTTLMTSALAQTPPKNTPILLLGSRIYAGGRPSLSLQQRIDSAYAYLKENPEAVCITTGGQGDNEPFAEALAEKNELVKMGIAAKRIFVEDKSRNTRQNMDYAMEIAQQNGLGTDFAVVTQDFHMFRSLKLAESAGFTAYSLAAKSDPMLFPAYYGRELLSLTKWKLEVLFLGDGK